MFEYENSKKDSDAIIAVLETIPGTEAFRDQSERDAAYRRGMADGLEAAANMADTLWQTGDETYGMAKLRNELRAEAERVRAMGVNNENTQ